MALVPEAWNGSFYHVTKSCGSHWGHVTEVETAHCILICDAKIPLHELGPNLLLHEPSKEQKLIPGQKFGKETVAGARREAKIGPVLYFSGSAQVLIRYAKVYSGSD
jgi:hypothetical protein